MITGNIKSQIDQIWNAFWSGACRLQTWAGGRRRLSAPGFESLFYGKSSV